MDFNHYFNNEELNWILHGWAETYPMLASLRQIGQSHEKHPIWLLVLTQQKTGVDTEKPAIWLDANIHATEIAGTTTTLNIAEHLLCDYGRDPRLTRLLDTCTFYIVPRVNPDGAGLAMADKPRYIRSGSRPYPFDEKGEGLHPEDIDGDGRILQMRIPDPNGEWKISSLNRLLMEKRGMTETQGQFYRLFTEGLIEDYDGYLIKEARPIEGLDFNRNFPFEWRPEKEQSGAGPYPTSEPEIRALADFVTSHPNINFAITFHTFSRALLRPYSTKADDEMITEDLWVYQKLGEMGTRLTGYRNASTYHEFKYHPKEVTTGAFDDWLYDHYGIYTYTIEQWDLPDEAGIKARKWSEWHRIHPHEQDVQILQWALENAGPDAYIDWYPFDHPQLGRVELGGWNLMYTWRNPPLAWMGKEAERHFPFMTAMAEMLPHLSIHTLEVKPLGGHDYYLNLVVENPGFLPTFTSEQGKKREAVRPVRVELELPEGATLVEGKRRVELGHLEGRSNKWEITSIWGGSQTDNRARAQWVIHSEPSGIIGLKIDGARAGSLTAKVDLAGL